jgi:minichromosome maintenance protein 10
MHLYGTGLNKLCLKHSVYHIFRKNDGGRCTMFVNKSKCEVCVFHLKKEYHKCSRRTELSSPGGGLINIRNKVLKKNEVSL